MANITNAEAVKFCNEEVRRFNDMTVAHYRTAKQISADYTAKGMSAILGATGSDVIVDGAATDGRAPMTVQDVNNVIARANEKISDFEANTNLKLNQANAVAVNTNPLF